MMQSEFELVRDAAAEILKKDPEEITARTRLMEDLGADSLEVFSILARLEAQCALDIPSGSLRELRTVGDVAALLVRSEGGER